MTRYGFYLADIDAGEFKFFRTEERIAAGVYRNPPAAPVRTTLYVAESVPALLMEVYPRLLAAELAALKRLGSAHMSPQNAHRQAEQMIDGLVRRLVDDDGIWAEEPPWLTSLLPKEETE